MTPQSRGGARPMRAEEGRNPHPPEPNIAALRTDPLVCWVGGVQRRGEPVITPPTPWGLGQPGLRSPQRLLPQLMPSHRARRGQVVGGEQSITVSPSHLPELMQFLPISSLSPLQAILHTTCRHIFLYCKSDQVTLCLRPSNVLLFT